jgi:hypothetical protein
MKKIILLFITLSIVSCKNQESQDLTSEETIAVDTTEIIVDEKPLTPQQQFLKENGFKENADFTESQFKEFKSTIQSGLFKKESFCEVYQKGLKLQGTELKQYMKKYHKIPYFEDLLFMYGPKVCDARPIQKDESYSNSSSYTNSDDSANPCIISEDFIKKDLQNPSTADFSMFDCSNDKNSDGTYTVLRKVSAKNSYGVEKEFIYKVTLGFKGGNWVDMDNWDLIKIQSEEYK